MVLSMLQWLIILWCNYFAEACCCKCSLLGKVRYFIRKWRGTNESSDRSISAGRQLSINSPVKYLSEVIYLCSLLWSNSSIRLERNENKNLKASIGKWVGYSSKTTRIYLTNASLTFSQEEENRTKQT